MTITSHCFHRERICLNLQRSGPTFKLKHGDCPVLMHVRTRMQRFSAAMVQCPLWVISGHLQRKKGCLLYPQKRTFGGAEVMSLLRARSGLQMSEEAVSTWLNSKTKGRLSWRPRSTDKNPNSLSQGILDHRCRQVLISYRLHFSNVHYICRSFPSRRIHCCL